MVEGLLPFTTAAMEAPIPEKSTSSVFKRYDGSADSDEHLRSFVNTMVFYSSSDPVWCRAFPLLLKREVQAWFNTSSPNIVDCFSIDHTLFRKQYASIRVESLTHLALISTKQVKDESLKDFMDWCNKTAWQVRDVSHEFILNNLSTV